MPNPQQVMERCQQKEGIFLGKLLKVNGLGVLKNVGKFQKGG
jgi:hypothetical protein